MDIDPAPFRGYGSGVDALTPTQTSARAGRRDGRSANEMRELKLTHAALPQADGSARVHLGATDVLVAIYGPLDPPLPKQHSDYCTVHVTYRRRDISLAPDAAQNAEQLASRQLRALVSDVVLAALFPRKAVVVAVQVLSDRGSVAAAAANATILALVNAGVPLRSVPIAATVAVKNKTLLVDPILQEEREADALITAAFDNSVDDHKGFVSVSTDGDCSSQRIFTAAVDTCRQLAAKTRAYVTLSLEEQASRKFVWSIP